MSHVDEGRLNAYLDGALPLQSDERRRVEAHLEVCPDCRTRLDEARDLRERAGEILALLEPPELRTPPFEELAARGGMGGNGRGRARRLPLAWAASVVLAVGAGWMGRAALETAPGSVGEGPLAAERVRSPEAADPGAGEAVRDAAALAAGEAGREGPEGTGAAAGDRIQDEPGAGTAGQVAERAGAAPAGEIAPGHVREPAEDVAAAVDRPAAPTEHQEAARAPAPETVAAEAVDVARARVAAPAPFLHPPATVGRGEVRVAPAAHPWIDRVVAAERAAESDGLWSGVSPAEAARKLGRAPADLVELPWERLEVAEVAGGVLVRSRHPLPGDRGAVELVQGRWEAAPPEAAARAEADAHPAPAPAALRRDAARPLALRGDEPPAAEPATASVGLLQADLALLIRGPLPVEELRALADRIR